MRKTTTTKTPKVNAAAIAQQVADGLAKHHGRTFRVESRDYKSLTRDGNPVTLRDFAILLGGRDVARVGSDGRYSMTVGSSQLAGLLGAAL